MKDRKGARSFSMVLADKKVTFVIETSHIYQQSDSFDWVIDEYYDMLLWYRRNMLGHAEGN